MRAFTLVPLLSSLLLLLPRVLAAVGNLDMTSPDECIVIAQISTASDPPVITYSRPLCPTWTADVGWPLVTGGDGESSSMGIYADFRGVQPGCVMMLTPAQAVYILGKRMTWRGDENQMYDSFADGPLLNTETWEPIPCQRGGTYLPPGLSLPDPETAPTERPWSQPIQLVEDAEPGTGFGTSIMPSPPRYDPNAPQTPTWTRTSSRGFTTTTTTLGGQTGGWGGPQRGTQGTGTGPTGIDPESPNADDPIWAPEPWRTSRSGAVITPQTTRTTTTAVPLPTTSPTSTRVRSSPSRLPATPTPEPEDPEVPEEEPEEEPEEGTTSTTIRQTTTVPLLQPTTTRTTAAAPPVETPPVVQPPATTRTTTPTTTRTTILPNDANKTVTRSSSRSPPAPPAQSPPSPAPPVDTDTYPAELPVSRPPALPVSSSRSAALVSTSSVLVSKSVSTSSMTTRTTAATRTTQTLETAETTETTKAADPPKTTAVQVPPTQASPTTQTTPTTRTTQNTPTTRTTATTQAAEAPKPTTPIERPTTPTTTKSTPTTTKTAPTTTTETNHTTPRTTTPLPPPPSPDTPTIPAPVFTQPVPQSPAPPAENTSPAPTFDFPIFTGASPFVTGAAAMLGDVRLAGNPVVSAVKEKLGLDDKGEKEDDEKKGKGKGKGQEEEGAVGGAGAGVSGMSAKGTETEMESGPKTGKGKEGPAGEPQKPGAADLDAPLLDIPHGNMTTSGDAPHVGSGGGRNGSISVSVSKGGEKGPSRHPRPTHTSPLAGLLDPLGFGLDNDPKRPVEAGAGALAGAQGCEDLLVEENEEGFEEEDGEDEDGEEEVEEEDENDYELINGDDFDLSDCEEIVQIGKNGTKEAEQQGDGEVQTDDQLSDGTDTPIPETPSPGVNTTSPTVTAIDANLDGNSAATQSAPTLAVEPTLAALQLNAKQQDVSHHRSHDHAHAGPHSGSPASPTAPATPAPTEDTAPGTVAGQSHPGPIPPEVMAQIEQLAAYVKQGFESVLQWLSAGSGAPAQGPGQDLPNPDKWYEGKEGWRAGSGGPIAGGDRQLGSTSGALEPGDGAGGEGGVGRRWIRYSTMMR